MGIISVKRALFNSITLLNILCVCVILWESSTIWLVTQYKLVIRIFLPSPGDPIRKEQGGWRHLKVNLSGRK